MARGFIRVAVAFAAGFVALSVVFVAAEHVAGHPISQCVTLPCFFVMGMLAARVR